MNQLFATWTAMEARQKVVAILATIAMVLALIGLVRVVNAPTMTLLYAGLDPATSGDIVTALEGRGVAYEARGDAIFVDGAQRDAVRMSLAAEGLPANGVAGYELLDNLSGFGTTSQMFDAAYWRAKEGELARTILASPQVRAARVHIANPVNRPFDRSTKPTASVNVTLASGDLSESQAQAIRYLVASAVAGLAPDQVSVIDSAKGIVLSAGKEPEKSVFEDAASRADAMRANIERLLAARVGQGKAVVEVNIDAETDTETITERVLDPEGRVAISSDTEERTSNSEGAANGGVTVASNLPDGDVDGGGGSSKSNNAETRERVNFDVSEVRRERIKHPGEIRRVSVAVLVDGVSTVAPDGTVTWAPRSEDELNALRELVKSAIGFDEVRGDVVTIETMEFQAPVEAGTLAEASILDFFAVNAMSLIQMLFLGIVALILGLFVLRPIFAKPEPEPQPVTAIDEDGNPIADIEVNENGEIEINPEVMADGVAVSPSVERLRQVINERASESADVLEDWLSTPEPKPARA